MEIKQINKNKKDYIDLLLLADEQESMVDLYLDRGTMYALDDNGVKTICVVTDECEGILEIKNIATEPEYQRMGYGKMLIDYVSSQYAGKYKILQVGTGESRIIIPFYGKCGFKRSHIVENFFIDNYDHEMYEDGVLLKDMVYLRKDL